MTSLDDRLHDALIDPNPRESEKRVKETVAGALERFDPSATVVTTSYFNHTFAPDMVLRWGKAERPVFLRFTDNIPELAEDIALLDRLDPLVFGLSTPSVETTRQNRMDERSREAEILFTSPAAVEELTSPSEVGATDRMLRNSLAHGGRGALVAREDASRLAQEVQAGFTAAARGTVSETRDALVTIDNFFRDSQARHLNRVLQAVWEGSGARLDQFPGERDLADQINDVSLRYLLQFMDTNERVFWRSVGRGLSVDQLIALAQADLAGQDNFQHLVNSNLDVLRARACLVQDMSLYDADLVDPIAFHWGVDLPAGTAPPAVTLRGPRFSAVITRTKELLDPRLRRLSDGLPMSMFLDRAAPAQLAAVDVSVGEKHVSLRDDSGTTSRDFLEAATSGLASPHVDKAMVVTPSGRVNVDFTHATGTGVTKSENLVAHLLGAAIPLLVELDLAGRTVLNTFLTPEEDPTGQPNEPLFSADTNAVAISHQDALLAPQSSAAEGDPT